MGIRTYACPRTGEERFEAYINVRSKLDQTIRIQKYKKCKTKVEALRQEKAILKLAMQQLYEREALGNCWGKVLELWEYEARKYMVNPATNRPLTEQTIHETMGIIKNWTHDWLKIPAQELARPHGKMILKRAVDKGLSKAHIRKIKNAINSIYEFGIQEGVIKGVLKSPVYGIPIDLPTVEKMPEILTVEQVKLLLSEAKARNHDWYAVWTMALMTGMRSGELFSLRKDNILMKEGLIRICESWDFKKKESKPTKAKYWRNAPIADELQKVISQQLNENTDSPYLFPRIPEWEKGNQAKVLRMFCEKINIPSIKFHTLRACFATHLLASGTDEATVMRIGGWRDLKTFQIYLRLAGVREQGATENLAAAFLPNDTAILNFIGNKYNTSIA